MYPTDLKQLTPSVRRRVQVERRIVSQLVSELLDQNYGLTVDDGGDCPVVNGKEALPILDALMNTDMDTLFVCDESGTEIGWVRLVYGNDGWDVMSDWTSNLDPLIPKTLALVDELS